MFSLPTPQAEIVQKQTTDNLLNFHDPPHDENVMVITRNETSAHKLSDAKLYKSL